MGRGEQVEADGGYRGEPIYIKTPRRNEQDEHKRRARGAIRARHETVNARIKIFKSMSNVFRHDLAKHGMCFTAVLVLTQLRLENDSPLFPVEY